MSQDMEPEIWHCPQCHGHGTLADAEIMIRISGKRTLKTASPCDLCKGKGVVLVQPLPDDYCEETPQ